jgi:hypothetical protein
MLSMETISKRFKFARWITWVFFAGSILLLAYIYYRSEIHHHSHSNHKYLKFYWVAVAAILFWAVVLRLKDEIKLNIIVAAISLIGGIYLVEMALTFASPFFEMNRQVAAAKAGVEFDTRSKFQVYRDLKNEGVDAVPFVPAAWFLKTNGVPGGEPLFPLGGVSGKITVGPNENGKFMIYPSDRYGFNNPDSEWDFPKTEWVLTGDSFTHGAAVQPGEDIASQIRTITGENVLNLGIGGNGPLIELAVIKEYAQSRKLKKLLWIYHENDLTGDLSREKKSPLLMNYLNQDFSQKLMDRQMEIDDRIGKHIKKELMSRAEKIFLKTRWLRLFKLRQRIGELNIIGGPEVNVEPLFDEILTLAKNHTAEWGGKLYFIYMPDFSRYATGVQNHDLYKKRGEVINVVKALNIPVIDIHQEVFANHPDPVSLFPFGMYGHFTAGGYSETAKAIVSRVAGEQHGHTISEQYN